MAAAILLAEVVLVLSGLIHFLSILAVAIRSRRPAGGLAPIPGPVSILRPVCGIENHIEATLASTFEIEFPAEYEVLFCVASSSDPVIPLVRRLIAAHPGTHARVLTGDDRISVNPKLNNLVKGWAAAKHPWIVMADSNVLMPPDYLQRLFAAWDRNTGLVCSPPLAIRPEGPWAELECAFLNTFQARWQLAADFAGLGFAQGKTMLWRREVLDRAGGIAALAAEVAEDAAATKIVRAAGMKVQLVRQPFPQPLGRREFREVWNRQLRWARLRRASFKLFFVPELLAGGLWPLVSAAFLVQAGKAPLALAPALALAWYGSEAMLARQMGWRVTPISPLFWFGRDVVLPWLWAAAVCGNRFVWRGSSMSVHRVPASDAHGYAPAARGHPDTHATAA